MTLAFPAPVTATQPRPVRDISAAASFQPLQSSVPCHKTVDILLEDHLLLDVPITVAWEHDSAGGRTEKPSSKSSSNVGVKFGNLTGIQKAILSHFISKHNAGNA